MSEITVDVDLLRSEIEKTYTEVSTDHAACAGIIMVSARSR